MSTGFQYTPAKGEQHPSSKLTENDVITIKQRLAKGDKAGDIAAFYGVSHTAISNIKLRRTWRHVTLN